MAEEAIKRFSEVLEEYAAQEEQEEFPEPLYEEQLDKQLDQELSPTLPEELRTPEATSLLKKIDEGIELAELGIKKYFNSMPKRAIEFQQNHIAYLELKAKILKLLVDGKMQQAQASFQQNNIIIDQDTAERIKESLVRRLYGTAKK